MLNYRSLILFGVPHSYKKVKNVVWKPDTWYTWCKIVGQMGKTILLADDNEEGRSLLEVFLQSKGYDCIVASNGKEALEKLNSWNVDLILSDVIMPLMDGFELLRRVKREEKLRHIPFILYSGIYNGDEDEKFAKRIGADRFFSKPYDFTMLLSAIEEEIEKRKDKVLTFERIPEEAEVIRAYSERLTSKLKKEAERWRTVFDSMLDMVCLLDEDGKLVLSNKAFNEHFGIQLKNKEETCFNVIKCPDYGRVRCPLAKAKKSRRRESREFSARNGFFFLETVEPIVEPDGSIRKFVQIIRDITPEKHAEIALKESEERYHSIFKHAIDGIYQITLEGQFLLANPSFIKMLGYDSFEDLKSSIKDMGLDLCVDPHDWTIFKKRLQKEGVIKGFETEFKTKKGDRIWVNINAHLIRDLDGKPIFVEGFVEETTERKKTDLELRNMTERLRRSLLATVRALSNVIELRDPYTAGHQRRVSYLAALIAEKMNLPNDFVETVRIAGEIHDIGKVAVPSEILTRPGKLFREEMDIIRRHPETGYEILNDAEMPDPIPQIVYQHHERLDGSGYPRGLKGEEIVLGARILAVADVVEVISSHRPYRPAIGMDAAREEIASGSGKVYDKNVVDACLSVIKNVSSTPF